jgi:hypothetical protein
MPESPAPKPLGNAVDAPKPAAQCRNAVWLLCALTDRRLRTTGTIFHHLHCKQTKVSVYRDGVEGGCEQFAGNAAGSIRAIQGEAQRDNPSVIASDRRHSIKEES